MPFALLITESALTNFKSNIIFTRGVGASKEDLENTGDVFRVNTPAGAGVLRGFVKGDYSEARILKELGITDAKVTVDVKNDDNKWVSLP